MNEKDTLIRVLEAGGHDQAAAFARALLPDQPAPTAGTAVPPADVAGRMAAATETPAGQAALAASATGGRQTERARYEAMTAEQLAALPDAEFQKALRLMKDA